MATFAENYACATKPYNLRRDNDQRPMTLEEERTLFLWTSGKLYLKVRPTFMTETHTIKEREVFSEFHRQHLGYRLYALLPTGATLPKNAAKYQFTHTLTMSNDKTARDRSKAKGKNQAQGQDSVDALLLTAAEIRCEAKSQLVMLKFVDPQVRNRWKNKTFLYGNSTITLKATDSLTTAVPKVGYDQPATDLLYKIRIVGGEMLEHHDVRYALEQVAGISTITIESVVTNGADKAPHQWIATYDQLGCPQALEAVRRIEVSSNGTKINLDVMHPRASKRFPCTKCLSIRHIPKECSNKHLAESLARHRVTVELPKIEHFRLTAITSIKELKKQGAALRSTVAPTLDKLLKEEQLEGVLKARQAKQGAAKAAARQVAEEQRLSKEADDEKANKERTAQRERNEAATKRLEELQAKARMAAKQEKQRVRTQKLSWEETQTSTQPTAPTVPQRSSERTESEPVVTSNMNEGTSGGGDEETLQHGDAVVQQEETSSPQHITNEGMRGEGTEVGNSTAANTQSEVEVEDTITDPETDQVQDQHMTTEIDLTANSKEDAWTASPLTSSLQASLARSQTQQAAAQNETQPDVGEASVTTMVVHQNASVNTSTEIVMYSAALKRPRQPTPPVSDDEDQDVTKIPRGPDGVALPPEKRVGGKKRQTTVTSFFARHETLDERIESLSQALDIVTKSPKIDWTSYYRSPELDKLLEMLCDNKSLKYFKRWMEAVVATDIDVPSNGCCYWFAIHAIKAQAVRGSRLTACSINIYEAGWYKKKVIKTLLEMLDRMLEDGTIFLSALYKRRFGIDMEVSHEEGKQELIKYFEEIRDSSIEKGLTVAQWASWEECMALIWFEREPLFVWVIGEDQTAHVQWFYLHLGDDGKESVNIAYLTSKEAHETIATFLRHRVFPLTMSCTGNHFKAVRFEQKFYRQWNNPGPNGETMYDRALEACGALGLYVPETDDPRDVHANLTFWRAGPRSEDSAFTPSSSALSLSQYSPGSSLTVMNPIEYHALLSHLNPHGRARGEHADTWHLAELANWRMFQEWINPFESQGSSPSSGPDTIQGECQRHIAQPEVVVDLMHELPYPEVAISLLPADTVRRLGQELELLSRKEVLRRVKSKVTSLEAGEQIDAMLLEFEAKQPFELRWYRAHEDRVWDHATAVTGKPEYVGQRSINRNEDEADEWYRLLTCLVMLTDSVPRITVLETHCHRVHSWMNSHPTEVEKILTQMRRHDWTTVVCKYNINSIASREDTNNSHGNIAGHNNNTCHNASILEKITYSVSRAPTSVATFQRSLFPFRNIKVSKLVGRSDDRRDVSTSLQPENSLSQWLLVGGTFSTKGSYCVVERSLRRGFFA